MCTGLTVLVLVWCSGGASTYSPKLATIMYLDYLARATIRRYLRCLSHCYWPLVAAAAALLRVIITS